MDIGDFKFFLEEFSKNNKIGKNEIEKREKENKKSLSETEKDEIKKQAKCNFLKNYEYYEGKKYIADFVNELIDAIYDSTIDKYTCINIANIINNLSKIGLTSGDLQGNEFADAVTALINNIFNKKRGNDFTSQYISLIFNGLSQLGYKKKDLFILDKNRNKVYLNIKALIQQFHKAITNVRNEDNKKHIPQNISLMLNGLSQLGYEKKDLKGLNIGNLIQQINDQIKDFNSQNISLMLNGLAQLGYKKEDLFILDKNRNKVPLDIGNLIKQFNKVITNISNKDKKHIPQNISLMLNGLSQLGYKNEDLNGLNIGNLIKQINKIKDFNSQHIANTLNGLAQLGYDKEDLFILEENGNKVPLNIGNLIKQINDQIKDFNSQHIANTLHGLGRIGYKFYDFKKSNIIPKLLKKYNSIQESKTLLDYLILMEGLMEIVYDHHEDLDEKQEQDLSDLKKAISKDVAKIVKEAVIKHNFELEPTNTKTQTEIKNLQKLNNLLIKFESLEQNGWTEGLIVDGKQEEKGQQYLEQLQQKQKELEQQELQKTEDTVQTVEENNKILPRREKEKLVKKIKKQKAQERQLQTKEERQQLKEMKQQRYNEEIEAIRLANNKEKQLHKREMASKTAETSRTADQMMEQYNKENKINEIENQQKDTKQKQKEEIKKQQEQENQEKQIVKAEQSNRQEDTKRKLKEQQRKKNDELLRELTLKRNQEILNENKQSENQSQKTRKHSNKSGNAIKKKLERIQRNQQRFERSEDKCSSKAMMLMALSGATVALGVLRLYYTK